jgi:glycolate oxidase
MVKESDMEETRKPKDIEAAYKQIAGIVGKDRVSKDEFETKLYSHDLASLPKMMELVFQMTPDMVVRPKDGRDVSKIIKVAIKKGMPVIPRGTGTWGLGGAVPTKGGILLDRGSMKKILDIDKKHLSVTVEPGITWKPLYDKLLGKGMLVGAYPSSAPGASVGGWINTGGIGVGSYKYGGVERQIRCMEVVLPDGKIIKAGFDKVLSNASGFNLGNLFVGSEGTLGVITKVTLRLHPAPEVIHPISYTFSKIKDAAKAIEKLTKSEVTPLHIGFFDGNHIKFMKKLGKEGPKADGVVNIALSGPKAIVNYEEKMIDEIMKNEKGTKTDAAYAKHEWDERYYELRTKRLGPSALVVEEFIPTNKLDDMIKGFKRIAKKMKLRASIVGMVPDRSTILFMPYVLSDERKTVKTMATMAFSKKLGDLAFKLGGRPGGLGTFFAVNLKKMHGKSGVSTICDIKATLDPHNIMNPGKFTEGVTKYGVPIPPLGFNVGMNVMGAMKGFMGKDK